MKCDMCCNNLEDCMCKSVTRVTFFEGLRSKYNKDLGDGY